MDTLPSKTAKRKPLLHVSRDNILEEMPGLLPDDLRNLLLHPSRQAEAASNAAKHLVTHLS